MAYPKYSIVITVDHDTGVATATSYTSKVSAKAAYVAAVNIGTEAYLYLEPQPNNNRKYDASYVPPPPGP